ncbi:FlgB family protein [Tabrizicola fusiformis]|uniref:FlgB family protein n=1 Tax=Tabrizicola sp. SY72 TaxID=2741673 RepID=UPI0015722C72|nr:FlgB family protein [Tabrizicola sp. SY72]NTT86680.1 FlgB family protein [Tabrizicola sp. SY72]
MFGKLEITAMAQSMAAHAGDRMSLIARNVANADTPGYRALDIPDFAQVYEGGTLALRATRPGHLGGGGGAAARAFASAEQASPNGNSVSIEAEMVKAAGARQEHEMALAIYRSTSGIIRASLGR